MRRIWLNLFTALMILGVGATSLYLRGMSSTDVTQVNSYKMDDGPYKGGKLTIVESLSSVPKEIDVSYSANASVSVYITSFISTIKVLCPLTRLSVAPTRVNILSTTPILTSDAGTKLPIWAISVISATCLM